MRTNSTYSMHIHSVRPSPDRAGCRPCSRNLCKKSLLIFTLKPRALHNQGNLVKANAPPQCTGGGVLYFLHD